MNEMRAFGGKSQIGMRTLQDVILIVYSQNLFRLVMVFIGSDCLVLIFFSNVLSIWKIYMPMLEIQIKNMQKSNCWFNWNNKIFIVLFSSWTYFFSTSTEVNYKNQKSQCDSVCYCNITLQMKLFPLCFSIWIFIPEIIFIQINRKLFS